MKLSLRDILNFVKIRIAISVAISSIVGYILATSSIHLEMLFLFLSILSLSAGSASLNQVQEWQLDGLMKRTSNRPIPNQKITPFRGLQISLVLVLMGLSILYYFGLENDDFLPLILGVLAIIFYNAIYTPLKRVTPYAALPGAFIGAIPPMIGWTLAGGSISHPQIILLAAFFFIWQIPHFWLLLIIYEEDYRRAGYPLITDILTHQQISRISFFWIISLVAVALMIPLTSKIGNLITMLIMIILGIYLIARSTKLIKVVQLPVEYYRYTFINLNSFVLFVMLILSFNKFLNI